MNKKLKGLTILFSDIFKKFTAKKSFRKTKEWKDYLIFSISKKEK